MTDIERERAEALYVYATCRHERDAVTVWEGHVAKAPHIYSKLPKAKLAEAQDKLRRAQEHARAIFGAVLSGEVAPSEDPDWKEM